MLLLKQDTTKKMQVDKKVKELNFEASNDGKKYKIEVIQDSATYANKLESGHLSGLYYVIA